MNEPSPVIRVVDDDRSFLTAVARLLRVSGFVVKTFSSATDLLADPEADVPGCVIADLRMPEVDGLQLQAMLARSRNPLPVVFLTGYGAVPDAVRAMRGGAEDFLTKKAPKEDLLAAVQRAFERDAHERRSRAHREALCARLATLTDREREILLHIVRGQLNKQMASDLGIHERTVKLHRTNLTRKLDVHSVAELTRLCEEAGILPHDHPPPQPES